VRIAAIFYSGLYEFDLNYVYTTLDTARTFFNAEGVDGIALKLHNPLDIDRVEHIVKGEVDSKLVRLRNWKTIVAKKKSLNHLLMSLNFTVLMSNPIS